MTAEFHNMPPPDQPSRVSCPPPAPKSPPRAYRLPPHTLLGISKPIPWPPSGARFPGDRISWLPMRFPEPLLTHEVSDSIDGELPALHLDSESDLGSEVACPTLGVVDESFEVVQEVEPASDADEDFSLENYRMGENFQVDACPDIDNGLQDPIIENPDLALELNSSATSDDRNRCDEQPTNRIESIPVTVPLRRALPLSGDTIRITKLADLLGLRGYEVLRDLIELEHFVKTTDSVSAELAMKVGLKHGVDFVMNESAADEADGRKCGVFSLTPTAAHYVNRTFRIKNGLHVRAGDWIRDSQLGLGRILKLNTDQDEPDRHQVWFVGNTKAGAVVEHHALYSTTLGIIDCSMIPTDIRCAAPEIGESPQ